MGCVHRFSPFLVSVKREARAGRRSDIPVPSHFAAVSRHCRFSCRFSHRVASSCHPVYRVGWRSVGREESGFRFIRCFPYPSHTVGAIQLCLPLYPFRPICSPSFVSSGGERGGTEYVRCAFHVISCHPFSRAVAPFPAAHRLRSVVAGRGAGRDDWTR